MPHYRLSALLNREHMQQQLIYNIQINRAVKHDQIVSSQDTEDDILLRSSLVLDW